MKDFEQDGASIFFRGREHRNVCPAQNSRKEAACSQVIFRY
jgi:hypothetical protein